MSKTASSQTASKAGSLTRRVLAFGDIHQAPNLREIEATIASVRPDVTVFTAHWLKNSLSQPDRIHLFGNHDIPYAFPHKATCPGWTSEKQYPTGGVPT